MPISIELLFPIIIIVVLINFESSPNCIILLFPIILNFTENNKLPLLIILLYLHFLTNLLISIKKYTLDTMRNNNKDNFLFLISYYELSNCHY